MSVADWECGLGVKRQMSYLSHVADQRPMLRVAGEVLLVFCCAAPLVLAFYESRRLRFALAHKLNDEQTQEVQHAFSIPPLS